jgi:hypothetical protein
MTERRLEREAIFRCRDCRGTPYVLYRRQNMQPSGELLQTFQHQLWPASPDVPPPLHPEDLRCPCGGELDRIAA